MYEPSAARADRRLHCGWNITPWCRLEGVYLKDLDMAELVEMSRAAVVTLASSILKEDPGADLRYLVLDLPCSFFMLRSLRWAVWCQVVWMDAVEKLGEH